MNANPFIAANPQATWNAYDYKAQKWISGPDALQLLRRQCSETLSLLQSERGQSYAKFEGRDYDEFLAETLRHARTLD